jgi:TonB family protein
MGWTADNALGIFLEGAERRGLQRAIAISLAGHSVLFGILLFTPAPSPSPLPPVISVSLVAAIPAAPAAATAAPAPQPKAIPKPAPPKPAPAPKPKQVLLPKEAAPVTAKPRPKPKPDPLEYEDAMAKLRDELGEQAPVAPVEETQAAVEEASSDAAEQAVGGGARVSPEVMAWMLSTKRHIRRVWITPPKFKNRGLTTELRVNLSASGDVLGTPTMVRSSGDPFWDDNTVRALRMASPLPPPPEAGEWPFIFSPE